jgi:hypothetical protein
MIYLDKYLNNLQCDEVEGRNDIHNFLYGIQSFIYNDLSNSLINSLFSKDEVIILFQSNIYNNLHKQNINNLNNYNDYKYFKGVWLDLVNKYPSLSIEIEYGFLQNLYQDFFKVEHPSYKSLLYSLSKSRCHQCGRIVYTEYFSSHSNIHK